MAIGLQERCPVSPNTVERFSPRFLVIGCGSIGQRHIANLVNLGIEKIHAFDVRSDRREEVESRFGIEVLGSLEAAWSRRPHIAVICAPTSFHLSLALQAAEQGCHLFIEKPLADRWEGVERLLKIVKERGLVSLVGCNLRFHPGLMTVKSLIDAGSIGEGLAARVEVGQYLPDWHPWEDYRSGYSARQDLGGGVILDAIHEIDYVRWLLGEAAAVNCFAAKLSRLDIDTEDTAAIWLRLASGAIAELHMDYIQRAYSRSCRIIGGAGTIHWDYPAQRVRWFSVVSGRWRTVRNPPGWEPNEMYLDEMRHFINCLLGKEKPALDVFEASRVLEVALAAKTCAQTQQWAELRGNR